MTGRNLFSFIWCGGIQEASQMENVDNTVFNYAENLFK